MSRYYDLGEGYSMCHQCEETSTQTPFPTDAHKPGCIVPEVEQAEAALSQIRAIASDREIESLKDYDNYTAAELLEKIAAIVDAAQSDGS